MEADRLRSTQQPRLVSEEVHYLNVVDHCDSSQMWLEALKRIYFVCREMDQREHVGWHSKVFAGLAGPVV